MTDTELAEIEKRANEASDGPWEYVAPGTDGTIHAVRVRYCVEHPDKKRWHDLIRMEDTGYNVHCSWGQRHRDAEFIAAARSDIPSLVAEVRRLRAAAGVSVLSQDSTEDAK